MISKPFISHGESSGPCLLIYSQSQQRYDNHLFHPLTNQKALDIEQATVCSPTVLSLRLHYS
jgi:hypothetical protein